jgi:hypothetical protein
MNQQNYYCRIEPGISTREAFEGICAISGWWAKNVEGSAKGLNEVFTTHFGETYGTFKIVEFEPHKKITWLTIDCYLDLLKNKKEWQDTKIVWEISTENNATQINMTHVGLVPGIECYNDCEKGWDFFIKESLYGFLTLGKGQPATGIRATIGRGERVYRGMLYHRSNTAPDYPDGFLVIDVRTTEVEHVTAFYAIGQYNKDIFDPGKIAGDHFMIVENRPLFGSIAPIDDLLSTWNNNL